jgi:hypothetical protein
VIRAWILGIVRMAVESMQHERVVAVLERQYEVQAQLNVAHARNEELRVALARRNADFDWMAKQLHEVSLERAQLYARLGVFVPVSEVSRADAVPPVDNYVPPARATNGDVLAKARELLERPAAMEPPSGELSFEDMGDAAAQAHGIAHTDDGFLTSVR